MLLNMDPSFACLHIERPARPGAISRLDAGSLGGRGGLNFAHEGPERLIESCGILRTVCLDIGRRHWKRSKNKQ